MKIVVASLNAIKISAVQEITTEYDFLHNAHISSVEVQSGVSEQPISFEETIKGARNRAKHAFQECKDCSLSFGIESGIMPIDGAYYDFSVCVIYDGKNFHLGVGPAYQLPKAVSDLIINEKITLGQAMHKSAATTKTNLGMHEGAIGVFSKGRIKRLDNTKLAIRLALVSLDNQQWYKN